MAQKLWLLGARPVSRSMTVSTLVGVLRLIDSAYAGMFGKQRVFGGGSRARGARGAGAGVP
jgi:hypothetical protein